MQGYSRKALIVLVLAVFTGTLVFGQDDYASEIDKLKAQFPVGTVPDLGNLTSSLPIGKIMETIKKKCSDQAGSDAAFEEAEQSFGKLNECIGELINVDAMMEEIKLATPTGDLEVVFNKYCRRRYAAMDCITNFTAAVTPCLSEAENEQKHQVEKMVERMFSFVCHKDGDQIALFIAEKGPECFAEKKDLMLNCVNETYGEAVSGFFGFEHAPTTLEEIDPNTMKLPEKMPELKLEKAECDQFEEVKVCITKVLEQCEETTPANLFESAAKFIRNESPCRNYSVKVHPSARGAAGEAVTVAMPLLVLVGVMSVVRGWFRRVEV